jgi:hypothetical protein
MNKKLLALRLAIAVLVAAVISACSIPSGQFSVIKHDYRGHVIHCTYAKIWHPSFPFRGWGYFEHRLISGPSTCGSG